MTAPRRESAIERHLTVAQVAELLGTTERFPRRLIAERRIEFVKIGHHVRISESALATYLSAHRVEPLTASRVWRHRGRVA